jgi:hypothetical protein
MKTASIYICFLLVPCFSIIRTEDVGVDILTPAQQIIRDTTGDIN